MIKLQVIGHLGKDCITNTVSGKNVINFSVAHTEKYKDAMGNQKERTTWVDCAYWTERTGIAPYLKKGQLVYVEGSPEARAFNRNDGTAGASLTLRVSGVQLLGGSGRTENQVNSLSEQPAAMGNAIPVPGEITEPVDDLPF
jgi:single-strand DNA-binding protein